MSHSTFWHRLARTLRIPVSNGIAPSHSNGAVALLANPADDDTDSGLSAGGTSGREPRALRKPRTTPIEQLQNAYERIGQLMDAMQNHFGASDERARALGASVERVATSVERLADAQVSQGRFIAAIAQHTETSARHGATLIEMPASLQAQADALRSLARHMAAAHEQGAHLVQSLQSFGRAVEGLSESGSRQTQTLERLHESGLDQVETLRDFLGKQGQRFTWLIATVLLVSVAAIAGLGTLTFALLSR